ncbi:hypothetical protein Btru_050771 [Bulinus truncatus]|nr:hypothetical protein Btru_050771 [Bulinus truncatus]
MERRFIEEMMVCPYDDSHVISPLRMPYHLLKCRKNFPTMDMAVCPFNALHEVLKPELRYHILHCPDKVVLERDIRFDALLHSDKEAYMLKGYTGIPHNQKHKFDPDEENWDDDVNFSTYRAFPPDEQEVPLNRDLETLRLPFSSPAVYRASSSNLQDDSNCINTISLTQQSLVNIEGVGRGRLQEQPLSLRNVSLKQEPGSNDDLTNGRIGRGRIPFYQQKLFAGTSLPTVGIGRGLAVHVRRSECDHHGS